MTGEQTCATKREAREAMDAVKAKHGESLTKLEAIYRCLENDWLVQWETA